MYITMMLRGETLRCHSEGVSLDLLFEIAEAFEDPNQTIKAVAVLRRTVLALVIPEDHAKLRAVLSSMPANTEAINELNSAVGGLIVDTGRPTDRPSPSPDGSGETGQPSRVVRLWQGTGETADQSQKDGLSAVS